MEQFPLKKNAKPSSVIPLHWKKRKPTPRKVGEAEVQSCHKPHPHQGDLQWGGNSQSQAPPWEVKVWKPHLAPQVLRSVPDKQVSNISSFKANGVYIRENHKTNWEADLKELACMNSPTPESSTEATDWNESRFSVKEAYFAYPKASALGTATKFHTNLEILLKMSSKCRLVDAIFLLSLGLPCSSLLVPPRGLYTFLDPPFFCGCHLGDSFILPCSGGYWGLWLWIP